MTIVITRKHDTLSLLKLTDEVCSSFRADEETDIYFFLGKNPSFDFLTGGKESLTLDFEDHNIFAPAASYSIPVSIYHDEDQRRVSVIFDYGKITPRIDRHRLSRFKDVLDSLCIKRMLNLFNDMDLGPIIITEPRSAKTLFYLKDSVKCKMFIWDEGIERKKYTYNSSRYEASSLGYPRDDTMQELLDKCYVEKITFFDTPVFTPLSRARAIVASTPVTTILSPSLECAIAKVGGVGAVVSDLAEEFALSFTDIDNHVISPDYDFLSGVEKTLVCSLRHICYGREIESLVYEVDNLPYKQFLVAPVGSLRQILSVGSASAIYSHSSSSSLLDRGCYLASATAAFIASMNLESKVYDIIHQHSWATALIRRLVTASMRGSKFLPGFITTIHGMLGETALAPIELVRKSGVNIPDSWEAESFNLFYEAIDNTQKLVMVSEYLFNSACSSNIPLRTEYVCAKDSGRMTYVRNGISLSRVSPLLDRSLEFSTEDILNSKYNSKKALEKASIISNADAPLFIYIGRYCPEKGIAQLPDMARNIIELGGQVIIVGKGGDDLKAVTELSSESREREELFFSLNDDSFQKDYLPLIRSAADFQLIPSLEETCGLVAMEALVNGAALITTGVGGLAELSQPIRIDRSGIEGNAFIYDDTVDSREAILRAVNFYKELSITEREIFLSRIIEESQGFSWKHAAVSYRAIYREICPLPELTLGVDSCGAGAGPAAKLT
jgi:glycogen synthase